MAVVCDGPCGRTLGKGDTMHTWSPDDGDMVLVFCAKCNPEGDTINAVSTIEIPSSTTEADSEQGA